MNARDRLKSLSQLHGGYPARQHLLQVNALPPVVNVYGELVVTAVISEIDAVLDGSELITTVESNDLES